MSTPKQGDAKPCTAQFKLSATLMGHTGDVRGACASTQACPIPFIATASRDETARLWELSDGNQYQQSAELKGHTRYLMCVTCTEPTPDFPQGLVVTGSLDRTLLVWNPAVPAGPIARLEGHTDAVCCVYAVSPTCVVSSSWDSTARVWDLTTSSTTLELKGHEASVLSVIQSPASGEYITASADRTIKRWSTAGTAVQSKQAHSDVIRALCNVSEGVFASCSNDTTICLWTTDLVHLQTFTGHTAFVYSVCAVPDAALLASSGEDGCVKVWDLESGDCVQTIDLPCTSVWNVAARWDGDVIACCDDATARVFTRSAERIAAPDVLTAFEEHVAASFAARQAQQVGSLKKSDIPDKSVLETPGRREGEHKIVNNGGKIEAYTWSGRDWQYMGLVTDAVAPDYTFTVDVDGKNLKLEYNKGENPYEVAQKFIHKHELSQSYLEQIANFIIQNAQVPTLETGAPQPMTNPDPFTGHQSATTGPSSSTTAPAFHNPDPFTGSAPASSASTTSASCFPNRTFVRFAQGKPEAAVKKLKEFNAQHDAGTALPAAAVAALEALVPNVQSYSDAKGLHTVVEALLKALEVWDQAQHVPLLDLLRLSMTTAAAASVVAAADASTAERITAVCARYREGPCLMLAMRVLTNLLAINQTVITPPMHSKVCETLMEVNMAALKDSQLLAVASYLLNLATWIVREDAERDDVAECQLHAVNAAHRVIVAIPAHQETAYRMLNAMGTLVASSEVLQGLAMSLPNTATCIGSYTSSGHAQTRNMAQELARLLK